MKELNKRSGVRTARRYDRGRNGGKWPAFQRRRAGGKGGWLRSVLIVLFSLPLLAVSALVKRPQGLVWVAVAAGVVFGAVVAFDYLTTGDGEIRRGVQVGEVDVGGMTREEAQEAISDYASTALGEIDLVSGEERFSVPGEDLGVRVDAAAAAEEPYAVGRRGGAFERLSDTLGSYFGGSVGVAAVGYDRGAARGALEGVARHTFDREPKDATFDVTDNGEVEVIEAQSGRTLDAEATLAKLDKALDDFRSEVALVADEKEPRLTTEEARGLAPTELIGEYKTDYAWDPDEGRQANLRMASEAVDNTVLAPGEVFSFTEQAGMLDYEKAKVFTDGGIGYEEGGGLCQVSSTMYMAANYAGLEIVERHPHYAELPYIPPGFDATVWFGEWEPMDMKFKNTTDGYLLVREFVDEEGFLTAQILGQEPTGKRVVMNTEKVEQSTTEGIKWITYKKVIGADGEVLFDDVMYEGVYSFNPPLPEELESLQHETNAPRVSSWLDPSNTTGWAEVQ